MKEESPIKKARRIMHHCSVVCLNKELGPATLQMNKLKQEGTVQNLAAAAQLMRKNNLPQHADALEAIIPTMTVKKVEKSK